MREKYLPIGSVVLLKGAEKKLVVMGLSSISDDEPNKIYDYIGCTYPEGIIDMEEVELSDHSQIDQILFVGYDTEEFKKYSEEVADLAAEYHSDNMSSDNMVMERLD